jgi:hypothetical protein
MLEFEVRGRADSSEEVEGERFSKLDATLRVVLVNGE